MIIIAMFVSVKILNYFRKEMEKDNSKSKAVYDLNNAEDKEWFDKLYA